MSTVPTETHQKDKFEQRTFRVDVISFGFKHGPPAELNLLFDVRFLPNPFYISELKPFTGREPNVAAYVLENDAGREFMKMLIPLLAFLVAHYKNKAKNQLSIGIGCTGGKHRSVAVVEALAQDLGRLDLPVTVTHRDMGKE